VRVEFWVRVSVRVSVRVLVRVSVRVKLKDPVFRVSNTPEDLKDSVLNMRN
jgi:hypothetical protein